MGDNRGHEKRHLSFEHTETVEFLVKLEYSLLDSDAHEASNKAACHAQIVGDHEEHLAPHERTRHFKAQKLSG